MIPRTIGTAAAVLLALLLAIGCGEGDSSDTERAGEFQSGRSHPTPENIPSDDEVADVISLQKDQDSVSTALTHRIRKGRVSRIIGKEEGGPGEMIARVEDVASGQGRLYLLDGENAHIKSYTADGAFEATLGRKGEGPEELMYPEAIDLTSDGRIVYADRKQIIKVLGVQDTSLVLENSFSTNYTPNDLCVLKGEIYVQGYAEERDKIVHVYSLQGEHLRSFGEPYRSDVPHVRRSLSRGRLACSEEAETVVMTRTNTPALFGYSADGELKWTTKLAEFEPSRIVEQERGMRYGGGKGLRDWIGTLEPTPQGQFFLQVARTTIPEEGRPDPNDIIGFSYLIDPSTGDGAYVGSGLPPHVRAITRNHVYSQLINPFPQLVVRELQGGG